GDRGSAWGPTQRATDMMGNAEESERVDRFSLRLDGQPNQFRQCPLSPVEGENLRCAKLSRRREVQHIQAAAARAGGMLRGKQSRAAQPGVPIERRGGK